MPVHIHLVGTSHIAQESLSTVSKTIASVQPTIIAIELDRERLYALKHPRQGSSLSFRSVRQVGVQGFLFALFGHYAEKLLGKSIGMNVGSDMLEAVRLAEKQKIRLALIDRPIQATLRRISDELTWKEKGRFALDLVKGVFGFGPKVASFDLRRVPSQEVVTKLLEEMKPRYPTLYKVLVAERNEYMAKKLKLLAAHEPDSVIVAIVGAGHVAGIRQLLSPKEK